ncbi:MAG TPA: LLM class flavin-dependent oxidoreductase [Nitrososphaerales archaeon]|nr:LLM class flavin-dependent oxidoreductase [Nitrososphaerales archaeon]
MGRRHGSSLHYGLYVPDFGKSAFPQTMARLARESERAGWDGIFLWDHILEWNKRVPVFDSFTILAAIAMRTECIRIGTTVTPLPRLKPWIAAKQVATLDHLSGGRMILGVGLGNVESTDYARFGESDDTRVLAQKLDESLKIMTGLWSGKRFSFSGKHYQVKETVFLPSPVQKPRVPIWVGGLWPRKGPYLRAAHWDGVVPIVLPERLARPSDIHAVVDYIKKHRSNLDGFDVVEINWTTGIDKEANIQKVSQYAEAGTTWWLESLYTMRDSPDRMRERIRQGPPR